MRASSSSVQSPRAMTGESITQEELFRLFEAARWAPSSGNSQPWRMLYAHRDTEHWPRFFGLVKRLQPEAVIFSDAGPDVCWCGNEKGAAGDPNWATVFNSRTSTTAASPASAPTGCLVRCRGPRI